jgi:hypothetical protein
MALLALMTVVATPGSASAWGYEGHEVVAAIAQRYLTPMVRARVDTMLAADTDTLTAHDMEDESTWADRYRSAGHPETGAWHFVDIELDHPDLASACFDFPASGPLAPQGPAQDCIVDKLTEFTRELGDAATPPAERLLALKYVLHFVGDIHQPLHAADNHDKGGNCVLISLGGARTVNLHSYWDTAVVEALGPDPQTIAATLERDITPQRKATWQAGDPKSWALESFGVARASAYTLGSRPGCNGDQAPISLTPAYAASARQAAAMQLEKAGVRLAWVLNRALGG